MTNMYSLQDAAKAYAKGAKRSLGEDANFLNANLEIVPIFVSLLFQSLEISLKHLGIESGLFTRDEAIKQMGHDVKKIAVTVNQRLGVNKDYPVIKLLTYGAPPTNKFDKRIQLMLFSSGFEPTRKSYQKRTLGYLELKQGDLQLLTKGVKPWVDAIEYVSENLPSAISVVSQWEKSKSSSTNFEKWYVEYLHG
jgi:hypothetical protein